MLTAEQQKIRHGRIGGSEIGALLGIDPHKSALDVFTRKTLPVEQVPAAHQEWGSAVEWAIVEFHAKAEGLVVERPGTLVHPDFAHVCATPDAIGLKPNAEAPAPRVIEVKNVGRWMAGEWGDEGDDCPFHYLAQVHWEMGVAIRLGLAGDKANLVAAIAGEAPRKFEVSFDAELYAGLVEVAERFARDHLETGKPPPGTPMQEAEYIRRRWAKPTDTLLEPTPELAALVQRVIECKAAAKGASAELLVAENALKAAIGEAQGIATLCTWKLQKRAAYPVAESSFRVLRLLNTKEK